ncbi:unnamed protein product [Diamesa serratosioi]
MNFLLSSLIALLVLIAFVASLDPVKPLKEVYGTGIDHKNVCKGPKPWPIVCDMSRVSYKVSKKEIKDMTKKFKKKCKTTPDGERICKFVRKSGE